jgi:ABC-type spermidine/putrescine transport system permease subunit I
VDGANWWQRTRYVTLPMMRNIIAITALFSLIVTFANFDIVRILTAGGPIDQTHILGGLIEGGAHRTVAHLADPAADVGLTRLIHFFGVSPKCAPTDFDEVKRAGSSIAAT